MYRRITALLITGFLLASSQLTGTTLSENGKSNYSIVISSAASPSEQYGAEEFQYFFQMITGAYLPIFKDNDAIPGPMVLIGGSNALQKIDPSIDFASFGDEGFIMKTAGQNLILAGGKLRGSMYAVYTFLEEKLGCRWYSSKVSRIPQMPTIVLGEINETQKPAFAYREPFWYDAFDPDWAARNKCNSHNARLDDSRGGKFKWWGGHNYYLLVPPARYFPDHPEYYSVINGKRIWEYAQLCLTNPEVVKLTTQSLLDFMDQNQEYDLYNVTPMDWANWCTCEKCKTLDEREESHAGTSLNFDNQIADRVKPHYPDKLIGVTAYQYTEKAPKTLQSRDNVCLWLANIICCDAHPLTECPRNLNWFTQNMRNWTRHANKILIWDYVTNFSHYMIPFPNWYATWKDIQFFKQNKVIGIFEEGAFQSNANSFEELEAYVQAKNLWNPELDYRVIVDDFLEGYYHKAAPAVKKYMDYLQSQVNDKGLHFNLYSSPAIELFSAETIARCAQYLDEAAKLVQDDLDAAYRIEELGLSLRYVKLAQPVEHILDGNLFKVAPSAPSYANLREVDDFIRDCKKHDVTYLRENGNLDESFRILKANVSNHRVVTLENSQLQIDVLPDLAGRIYRIIDKKTNRNYLQIPALNIYPPPFTRFVPADGYSEGGTEYFTHSLEKNSSGQRVVMEALAPGNKITRSFFIPAGKKEIQVTSTIECLSILSNRRDARPICISPRIDLSLGNWEDVRSGVKSEKQEYNWKQLARVKEDRRQEILITTFFNDREIKGGVWIVVNEKENAGIMDVFNPDEVEMCTVSSDSTTGCVRMSLGGVQRILKPGDKLTLSHKIVPIDDVKGFGKR